MGAFVPGTLILQNSPEGMALLAQVRQPVSPVTPLFTLGGGEGGGGGGGLPFPPLPGGGGPPNQNAPVAVPFTGTIREWQPNEPIPADLQGLLFNAPPGFSTGALVVLADGLETILNISTVGGISLGQIIAKLKTLPQLADQIAALIVAGVLIGGQLFESSGQTGGGTSGTDNTGEGPINITNIVNVTDQSAQNAIQNLASAVQSAIRNSVAEAQAAAQQTTKAITDTLGGFTNQMFGWVKDLGAWLKDNIGGILKSIVDNIGPILKKVVDEIGTILVDVKNVIVDVIGKIAPVLDAISQQVQKINDTLIQPIANFINTTVRTIADLTVAIEKDLHDGLSGLLKIPTDIATGLTSLDSSLNRTVQQIGTLNKDTVDSTFKTTDGVNVAQHLKDIGANLAKSTGFQEVHEAFPDRVKLSEPSAVQIEHEVIAALKTLMTDMFSVLIDVLKDPIATAETGLVGAGLAATGLLEVGAAVGIIIELLLSVGSVIEKFTEEEINRKAPLTKLDAGMTAQALVRHFITEDTFNEELLVQGYDATRSKVIKDLTSYYVPADVALEWWYRGIINETDLNAYLQYQGYDDKQVTAAKEASIKTVGVDSALIAWRRGIIDDTQLDSVFQENRVSQAERDIVKAITLRPQQVAEAIHDATHQFAAMETDVFASINQQAPDSIVAIAARNGIDSKTANTMWRAHWVIPTIQTWVQLYFRGLRTRTELVSALDYFAVPREMQDDMIESLRPLIPYRSIPGYVKAGILSDAQGRQELAAHGYDLDRVNKIMEFAGKTTSAKAPTQTSAVTNLSLGTAHTLFHDGAITKEQYVSILEAHGFAVDIAQAQADATELQIHAAQRKQVISDALAEVETGVITLDDAISSLTKYGLSDVEMARFQAQVRRNMAKAGKSPSMSDLKRWIKAQLITIDQFKQELQRQGWADPWLTLFVTEETPTPAEATPAPVGP